MRINYYILIFLTTKLLLCQTFIEPTDNFKITQFYADFNNGAANKWHTGLDAKNNSIDSYSYSTNVKAIGNGTIYKIFGLEISGNNLRKYNSSTSTYSWTTAPTSGMNHGLGICIIIYHSDMKLYSLYGHLDAVLSNISIGQSVTKGQIIGRMGNSYKQYLRKYPTGITLNIPADAPAGTVINASDGFGPHVHLEVKDRGLLSCGKDESGPYWGYTPGSKDSNMPGHPNYFGYHDPNLFFNNNVELINDPIPIEILQTPLNVRDYPSTNSALSIVITGISQRTDDRKPAFAAMRKVGTEWFQIYLPNLENEGWSASGWVAGNLNSVTYSQVNNSLIRATVINNLARVYELSNASSSTVAFIYGENSIDRQRFINFDETTEFIRIFLPEKANKSDGWVKKSDITDIIYSDEVSASTFKLYQNYPNPFNPKTTISYSIPKTEFVSIKVYDVLGNEVQSLVSEEKESGNYNCTFDGLKHPSGVYLYRIQAGQFVDTKKFILMK